LVLSPYAVDRSEIGEGEAKQMTPHEAASALSYTLLDGPPDSQLLAAADSSALTTSQQLEAQAQRLVSQKKAPGLRRFVVEYLTAPAVEKVDFQQEETAEYDDAIRAAERVNKFETAS